MCQRLDRLNLVAADLAAVAGHGGDPARLIAFRMIAELTGDRALLGLNSLQLTLKQLQVLLLGQSF